MILHQIIATSDGFELNNLTLMISVFLATVQRRFTGVNPGGLISGAFIILAAESSLYYAAVILLMGFVISVVYKRFFSHIYSGREPLFYMAFMSVIAMLCISALLRSSGLGSEQSADYLIGLIVPAILANAIVKQGARLTYVNLACVILISVVSLIGVYLIGISIGHDFHALDKAIALRQRADVNIQSYMAVISIIIGFVVYKLKRIKFAGYVILPFLATILIHSPLNFVLVIGLTTVVYIITALIRRYTLIIGIGRYAFVLILSIVLVWTSELILIHETTTFSPFLGTSIFASLAIAVIVNDTTLYGLRRAVPAFVTGLTAMTVLLLGAQSLTHVLHHSVAASNTLHEFHAVIRADYHGQIFVSLPGSI